MLGQQKTFTGADRVTNQSPTSTSDDPAASPKSMLSKWRLIQRMVLIGVLVNTTLFFRGCSMSDTNFTAGFPLPAVEYRQDLSQDSWDSRHVQWLPRPLIFNLVAFSALAGLAYFVAPFSRLLFRGRIVAALVITFVAFNLVIISPTVWIHTTFSVESWLAELILGDERRVWVMDAFSRAYFVTFAMGAAVLCTASRFVWQRHVTTSGNQPWQIQLVGMFVITTLVAVVTAIIILATRS